MVRRGGCQFHEKARRAQAAGAVAVLVVNTEPGPARMGDLNNEAGDIIIPVLGDFPHYGEARTNPAPGWA